MNTAVKEPEKYTRKEFLEFIAKKPENEQYELVDGYIYAMSPSPSVTHQRFTGTLFKILSDYLNGKSCEAFIAPLDVYLYDDENECENIFQPDIFVVCDKDNIKENGCHGAPDFVIEIVSPSTSDRDYMYKLYNYFRFGVREYWIVNPKTKQVSVYYKADKELEVQHYSFDSNLKVNVLENLYIDFSKIEI